MGNQRSAPDRPGPLRRSSRRIPRTAAAALAALLAGIGCSVGPDGEARTDEAAVPAAGGGP